MLTSYHHIPIRQIDTIFTGNRSPANRLMKPHVKKEEHMNRMIDELRELGDSLIIKRDDRDMTVEIGGYTGKATCHPKDEFSYGKGFTICVSRILSQKQEDLNVAYSYSEFFTNSFDGSDVTYVKSKPESEQVVTAEEIDIALGNLRYRTSSNYKKLVKQLSYCEKVGGYVTTLKVSGKILEVTDDEILVLDGDKHFVRAIIVNIDEVYKLYDNGFNLIWKRWV